MSRPGIPGIVLKLCFTILFISIPASTQVPADFHPQLTVLHSDSAASPLPTGRVLLALRYAADEMGATPNEIPRIIVVRGCSASAKVADSEVTHPEHAADGYGTILMYELPTTKEKKYELWVVGDNAEFWLAKGLVSILAMERGRDVNQQQDHILRVVRRLSATTTFDELLWPSRKRR